MDDTFLKYFDAFFYSPRERERAAELHAQDPSLSHRDINRTLKREVDERIREETRALGLTEEEASEFHLLDLRIGLVCLRLGDLKEARNRLLTNAARRRDAADARPEDVGA